MTEIDIGLLVGALFATWLSGFGGGYLIKLTRRFLD
jgi:hypothetical protein